VGDARRKLAYGGQLLLLDQDGLRFLQALVRLGQLQVGGPDRLFVAYALAYVFDDALDSGDAASGRATGSRREQKMGVPAS
jgi:hypothetical protein